MHWSEQKIAVHVSEIEFSYKHARQVANTSSEVKYPLHFAVMRTSNEYFRHRWHYPSGLVQRRFEGQSDQRNTLLEGWVEPSTRSVGRDEGAAREGGPHTANYQCISFLRF